jgi:hypothetical protein
MAAADDFNYTRFVALPQVYLNFLKSGTYRSAAYPAYTPSSWTTPEGVRRVRPKRTRQIVTTVEEDSDSDASSIVVVNSTAQVRVQEMPDASIPLPINEINAMNISVLETGTYESEYNPGTTRRYDINDEYRTAAPASIAHFIHWAHEYTLHNDNALAGSVDPQLFTNGSSYIALASCPLTITPVSLSVATHLLGTEYVTTYEVTIGARKFSRRCASRWQSWRFALNHMYTEILDWAATT